MNDVIDWWHVMENEDLADYTVVHTNGVAEFERNGYVTIAVYPELQRAVESARHFRHLDKMIEEEAE